MPDESSAKQPRARRGVFSSWWKRPPAASESGAATAAAGSGAPERIGHYRVTGTLGRGGMGVVYAARDERLERDVALKVLAPISGDPQARQRFWREARAAASVNHPNICQLYEIGEDQGEPYIAMELLEGESLAERLRRGPLGVADTVTVGLGVLAALGALHARGIVHRDLKPSNVFLTPHGAKLLDFGLARAVAAEPDLTRTGVIVGTPRYMAPEQVSGGEVDARTDLFAAAAILFEMLAGRPAFQGANVIEVLHATRHVQPPALTGSPAVAAIDRVIRRALAKRPGERPDSAAAMAEELRGVDGSASGEKPALARPLTRLVVLPFRVLRPDPETDFLAFSLPDAIATSLTGFGSLVVRSSAAAARFAGEAAPDLKALAAEADVDRVVLGTLVRAGDQLRATAQLVEAPGGTLVTSHAIQSSLGDLFRLQDDITRRVVEALSLPLTGGAPPTAESPHDPRAYELYLRANAMARSYEQLPAARELYQRCLELDPRFAPAWAQIGRCHWVIGKYIESSAEAAPRAEAALTRALELSPDLSVAHKLYASFEADQGRAPTALRRLLEQAARHRHDPELFAGLVHACRYCGLYEASIAAHHEARRLDPHIPTSHDQTLLMAGDVDRLLAAEGPSAPGGADWVLRAIALGLVGRRDEALRELDATHEAVRIAAFGPWIGFLRAWLERRPADMLRIREELGDLDIIDDPEAVFQEAWMYCDAGDLDRGLAQLRRVVGPGYAVAPTLERRSQFDPLRDRPEFQALLAEARAGRDRALELFRAAGGERLLGL